MKKAFILLLASTLFVGSIQAQNRKSSKKNKKIDRSEVTAVIHHQPKNVIFIVGDGMGTAQVYSSIVAQKGESQFLRFPVTGFSRTYSNNKYTTDSGAGGSALATGHKVDNKAIAQSPTGEHYPSLYDTARKTKNKHTGFVVSCSVLDATPASTYGHVAERYMWDKLSLQLSQCGHDVMIGADKASFLPEKRKDGLAPIDTLIRRGYKMLYSQEELQQCNAQRYCALLSENDAPGDAEKRNNWLAPATQKAISTLSKNQEGFVLMIEGSQIDWACHNNDYPHLMKELNEFELMLRIVLDFAEQDGETLVVVTADHETGGLTLHDGDLEEGTNETHFTTGSHTGVMVPVFAYGPGASYFTGIHQNTDFYQIILDILK